MVRLILALVLAGSAPITMAEVVVSEAWVRAMPPGLEKTAGYMVLENTGQERLEVVGVASPDARAVEIHESWIEEGMWRMQRLERLSLPPGLQVALEPGGMHLMVFGVTGQPRPGDSLQFRLALDNGDEVEVWAEVRRPGQ